MFCPLCKAEYREGFQECSTCGARLVPDDAAESERHPPRLVWVTQDRAAFYRASVQLREAGIPRLESSEGDFWFYILARQRPTFTLFILERDAPEARKVAGVEFQAPEPEKVPIQVCPFCRAEFPEGGKECPACGAELPVRQAGKKSPRVLLEQCPLCRAEFPAGAELCPGCGAEVAAWKKSEEEPEELAAESEPEPDSNAPDEDLLPELVWLGGDPVVYSRALLALREAGIKHVPSYNFAHMVFDMAIPRPRFEIRVYRSDAERARELLSEFQDTFPLVPQSPFETDGEENREPAEPISPGQTPEAESLENARTEERMGFERRKRSLQWGVGLGWVSFLLAAWVMRTPGFWHLAGADLGSMVYASLVILTGTSLICAVASVWFLYRSWAWRGDKIGFLAWLFGYQVLILLLVIIFAGII